MYKENIIISFSDSENWVKWYGEKVVVNGETRGKKCQWYRYYFDCPKCKNQSLNDDEGGWYSCNNFEEVFADPTGEDKKLYCKNYEREAEE